jgi:hypothetical protein
MPIPTSPEVAIPAKFLATKTNSQLVDWLAVGAVMRELLSSLLSGKIQRNTGHSAAPRRSQRQKSAALSRNSQFKNRENNQPEQGTRAAAREFLRVVNRPVKTTRV